MKFLKYLSGSMVTAMMLVSCVTINIYFPAAAAEKAADRIIEDIWGPESETKKPSESQEQQSYIIQSQSFMLTVLDWVIKPAAAEADLNISSAAINTLQQNMKDRHVLLKPYYDNGAVGLTEQGLLSMHDATAISLKNRNLVKGLLADENKDRMALYSEIARANGHPEWQDDIQATFARRWVDKAAKGWWFKERGEWKQK